MDSEDGRLLIKHGDAGDPLAPCQRAITEETLLQPTQQRLWQRLVLCTAIWKITLEHQLLTRIEQQHQPHMVEMQVAITQPRIFVIAARRLHIGQCIGVAVPQLAPALHVAEVVLKVVVHLLHPPFINYLLDPKVAAANTNFVTYPNPVPSSKPMVDKAIADDPTIYPPADVDAKLFTFAVLPPEVDRQYTRIWTELKTGR